MTDRTPTVRRTRRRSAGEGSIYRTADGRWRGAVTWTQPDGSRERRFVSAATATEARDKLDVIRAQHRRGGLSSSRLTVAEYLTQWIERDRARVRPATWRGRETHVRVYLVPALGRLQLARLTPRGPARGASASDQRPPTANGHRVVIAGLGPRAARRRTRQLPRAVARCGWHRLVRARELPGPS